MHILIGSNALIFNFEYDLNFMLSLFKFLLQLNNI